MARCRNKAHGGGGSDDEIDGGAGGELVVEVMDKSLEALETQGSRRSGVCSASTFNRNANAQVRHGVDEGALGGVGGVCGVLVENVVLSKKHHLARFKESHWPSTFGGVEAAGDDANEAIQATS